MAAKNILILGAAGRTGRQVVAQALARGHAVTVLVRRGTQTAQADGRVRVLRGDVLLDAEALAEAAYGQDVVISTLGAGNSFKSAGLMERSVPAIVRAMEHGGVKRLVLMSACGVGATIRQVPLLPRLFMKALLGDIYADKKVGENLLRESLLDWTIVYPVMLTDGPRTGRFRFGEQLELRGFPRISRADVAGFLLDQLENDHFIRKGVLVSP